MQTKELKSQFISMVSHELRTPLTALNESLSILKEMLDHKLNADESRILELSQRNMERLLRFSQEVLDFSRLESGHLVLNITKVKIQELVTHLAESMRPLAKKKALHLELKINTDLPKIPIDADKISQVVLNLLSNSIKFTPLGGRVTLSVTQPKKSCLAITVEDNGVGIPKDHHKRIFEPFVHLNHLGNKMPGAGLGLSISKRLVELQGGRISFESAGKNKGCRFIVELPIK